MKLSLPNKHQKFHLEATLRQEGAVFKAGGLSLVRRMPHSSDRGAECRCLLAFSLAERQLLAGTEAEALSCFGGGFGIKEFALL